MVLFQCFFSVRLLSILRGHSVFSSRHNGQWPPTSKERITVGLGCNVGQCNWPLQCGMGDAVCRLNEPESHILSCYIDLLLMQCKPFINVCVHANVVKSYEIQFSRQQSTFFSQNWSVSEIISYFIKPCFPQLFARRPFFYLYRVIISLCISVMPDLTMPDALTWR